MAGNGPVLNLLFIGDVVGKGGRNAVSLLTPELKQRFHCSFAIVNGETARTGRGSVSHVSKTWKLPMY